MSERACAETCIRVGGQSMFLGTRQDMDDIADAFLKVREYAGELRSLDHATPDGPATPAAAAAPVTVG